MSNGVRSAVIGDGMTRAPVVRMPSAIDARFEVYCYFLIEKKFTSIFLLAIIENQADNTYNSNYMYKD